MYEKRILFLYDYYVKFFCEAKKPPRPTLKLILFYFFRLERPLYPAFCFNWISLKTLYRRFKRAFFINNSGFAASGSDMMNGQKKPSSLVRIFDCTHYLEKVKSS